jgi:predicted O-methyltransferase YrrM
MSSPIEGQLNEAERQILRAAVKECPEKPSVVVEVGTWLGGGSTIHLLRALEENGEGHLWGVEADRSIYERMLANIAAAAPMAKQHFTPLFGFSDEVLPQWIREQPQPLEVDIAFLDGGNNPMEQITEFRLLDPLIPVGGQLLTHDARMRKGKWLVPYVSLLDNWETTMHDVSENGLFYAKKTAAHPSPQSLRAASRKLFKLRLQPAEIAAAFLPSWICGFVLKLLPSGFSRRLSDGPA